MFKTILTAVDGSDHALHALAAACDIAKAMKAELHLVTVPEVIVSGMDVIGGVYVPTQSPDEMRKNGEAILGHATAEAEKHKCRVVGQAVLLGDPADEIVAYAKLHSADLIVLGRRGLGSFKGLLFGSTSQQVAHDADCAVMTVK